MFLDSGRGMGGTARDGHYGVLMVEYLGDCDSVDLPFGDDEVLATLAPHPLAVQEDVLGVALPTELLGVLCADLHRDHLVAGIPVEGQVFVRVLVLVAPSPVVPPLGGRQGELPGGYGMGLGGGDELFDLLRGLHGGLRGVY